MTRSELAARLARPLERELADGCQNRVVAGGQLERLVNNLAGPFSEVRSLIDGYSDLPTAERAGRLRQALMLLKAAQDKTPTAAKSRPPAAAPAKNALTSLPLGPSGSKKLSRLGIQTPHDLLHYYPRRYEDRRVMPTFTSLQDGEKATVRGLVTHKRLTTTKKRQFKLLQAGLQNDQGDLLELVWFNQPWVLGQLRQGARYLVSGRVQRRGRKRSLAVEHFEADEGESLSSARITPIYPSLEGISQAFIRRIVWQALEEFEIAEQLPKSVRKSLSLVDLAAALRNIHFPHDEEALGHALRRLRFDEYLFLELRIMLQSGHLAPLGRVFEAPEGLLKPFFDALPFTPTGAQTRAIREILADMNRPRQMARLLQGDVGSGKTMVAAAALYVAARNSVQGSLMAPTEVLARQHFANLTKYLWPLGIHTELLISAMSAPDKRTALGRIASGEAQVVVGTQALIQEGVAFHDLGLAVVDEEHRFGVEQRRALLSSRPDLLVMSATPIPRSLALTLYGDLEVSSLDELPPGRSPIKTKLLSKRARKQAYAFAEAQIRKGCQVFVVAPLIEASETRGMSEIQAARELFHELRALLPEVRIRLLHGRMDAVEKETVMQAFRNRQVDLLVSTTVVEVGVDVPGATVMIVENAERFGLAQLHQLRGRVGRGQAEAYCLLIAGEASRKTTARLKVIEQSTDGFFIAEQDLKLRGPGELRGTRQSGLPELKLADLAQDAEVIEQARDLARRILQNDPRLETEVNRPLVLELEVRSRALGLRELV